MLKNKKYFDKKALITSIREFYFSNNEKLNSRDISSKNGLPAISTVYKICDINSIVEVYTICNLPIKESKINLSNRKVYTIEGLRDIFKNKGCVLLSDILTDGVHSKVDYICECKEKSKVKVSDFIHKNTRCYKCGLKKNSSKRRKNYDEICEEFYINGCTLISRYDEYINGSSELKFICKCGREDLKTLPAFKLTPYCTKCHKVQKLDSPYAWKGGISPIAEYCRKHIDKWKADSMKKYNYKCDITGSPFDVVHHLNKNFSDILHETLQTLGLEPKKIKCYTKEELESIVSYCNELHDEYGLGVCLSEDMHKLFHQEYGMENNTSQQYYEFKSKFN